MNTVRLASSLLLIGALVCSAGCNRDNGTDPNPIEGWKIQGAVTHLYLPDEITADYLAYLGDLPPEESALAKNMHDGRILDVTYLKDGSGQHAVTIELPLKGIRWVHVLIYDQSNKRIKVVKYRNGRYAC